MRIPINFDVVERFIENFRYRQGASKHRAGRRPSRNHRLAVRRRRKAERQARRRAYMIAKGRKHRWAA